LTLFLTLLACHTATTPDTDTPGGGSHDTAPEYVGDSAGDSAGDSQATDTGDSAADTAGVDTAPPPPACAPGADPVYGLEGVALTQTITCTGPGTAASFDVDGLPDGATWDPSTATVRWTPTLAQAARWDLRIVAHGVSGGSADEEGWSTIWVADAWREARNTPVDPTAYPEEYGLPVLHLTRPSSTNSSTDVATSMVYRGMPYDIGLKYRGASSLYYPKNSYTLSFSPDHEFSDPASGFPDRRQIVLTSTFDDNSYIRQKMCFDVFNALSPTQNRVETRFVVVYINGAYEGLYVLGDHIDSEWWQDNGYADGDTANIYKAVSHEANFYTTYSGRRKSSLHAGYDKKHGDGSWSDLDDLVDWVSSVDDTTFAAELDQHIAVEEFMDWWILVRFTEADDSAGKNSYLYNDTSSPLFHYAPWDFNHSLGQTWQTDRESVYTDEDFAGTNNIFNRMMADPGLSAALYDRYRADLAGELSAPSLNGWLDDYYAEIDPSAARDWDRWGDSYYSYGGWSWRSNFTTYDEEKDYIRGWVTERVAFMETLYP